MGYTKIIEYGDIIETYEYSKRLTKKERKPLSKLQKKRASERRRKAIRRAYSIRRSVQSFFRLVHHNNLQAKSISFVTLTFANDIDFKTSSRYVSHFFQRIKKTQIELPISYISVPEFTKKGRIHYHLLVYNLPTEMVKNERNSRYLQRQFSRGYLDLLLATNVTTGIAGYMAKYMRKTFEFNKSPSWRGYNCSRNIKKIYSAGSNSLDSHIDLFVDKEDLIKTNQYDTMWLGSCIKKTYKNQKICKL